MAKLPPHNQRRLNARIAEVYGDRYSDWYELARELQAKGATYTDIRDHFSALGVRVSMYTICKWLAKRESLETVAA